MSLTLKEVREHLNSLPKELDNSVLVFREVTESDKDGEYKGVDTPIFGIHHDKDTNYLVLYSYDTYIIIEKITKT